MSQPRKGGLGRGLAALIPTGPEQNPRLTDNAADLILGPKAASKGQRGGASIRESSDTGIDPSGVEPTSSGRNRRSDQGHASQSDDVSRETPELVETGAVYREVPLSRITPNPKQPRTVFDEEALAELTHSVKEFGLLQPIVVREMSDGDFQLIMGERRWRASQNADLETIPAIVRQTEDEDLLRDALLENIHRVQLNPLEEAAAYQQLLEEFNVSQVELAQRIGRSRPAITNSIRLLQLSTAVQRRVAAGVLSAGHARALLGIDAGKDAQDDLAARIVAEGLSVRATEEIVTLFNREADSPSSDQKPRRRTTEKDPQLDAVAEKLSDWLETKVSVSMGRRKGRISIDVGDHHDLERVLALLHRQSE